MMKNTFKRGFTLIELLVVIAIIGILASVVLASLNTARDKGSDAAIQSSVNNSRAQAELSYTNNNRSYDSVCTDPKVVELEAAAEAGDPDANTAGCGDDANEWAMSAQLNSGAWYCVDYKGAATTTGTTGSDPRGTGDGDIDCD